MRLPNPLFEGDTVYSRSEVLETRESKSRPTVGIVRVKTTGVNQDKVPVIEFTRTFMIWKRGHVPGQTSAQSAPSPSGPIARQQLDVRERVDPPQLASALGRLALQRRSAQA